MHIFDQEKIDGLEAQLSSSASISYACIAEPIEHKSEDIKKNIHSLASFSDDDLYYVQSILVSSSWNKNDDIFDKKEVWIAKNTPEDKPTNLEHDENIIIGHITSNWPITEEGILIDENTEVEDLPEKYHILTGSVIYKSFTNPELKDRSEKLIAEIQDGTKYVSMECFFKGFDYGLIEKNTGTYKILSRNNETAYLSKYLRSYGGLGEHENYKIGRVLRNITFSGKGFVDRPANQDSIIFTKNLLSETDNKKSNSCTLEKKEEIIKSGVFITQANTNSENTIMSSKEKVTVAEEIELTVSDDVVYTKEASDSIQAKIAGLASANLEMEDEMAQAAKKTKEQIKKMQEEMDKMSDDSEAAIQAIRLELDTANSIIETYRAAEAAMMKKEKNMLRKASLVDKGLDAEIVASILEKFDAMEDEAFDAMTFLFAAGLPPWLEKYKKEKDGTKKEDPKKEDPKKKASEDNSDISVLEDVEVEDSVSLSVSEESAESSLNSTRAALVEFVYSKLGNKKNK
jgi:hypothetical protein